MSKQAEVIDKLTRRLQACLKEEGVDFEIEKGEHEVIIAARDVLGSPVRIVAHISDREVVPGGHGLVANEIARAQMLSVAARPTLSGRSAAGSEGKPPRVSTSVVRTEGEVQ